MTPGQISEFVTVAKGMVGKVPGLRKLEANTPHISTAHRGQGFNMGIVAILDKGEDIKVYAEHPAHLEYVNFLFPFLLLIAISLVGIALGADSSIESKTSGLRYAMTRSHMI